MKIEIYLLFNEYRCWISIKDKKEYEKFKIEQEKYTKLYQNPLFKPATSYYQVPSRLKENWKNEHILDQFDSFWSKELLE